jgi:hypothetical protein
MLRLWLPSTWVPTLMRSATAWTDLLSNFPRQTTRILNQVERGELQLQVYAPMAEQTKRHLNRMANRVILGVVLAALIVAVALLIPTLDLSTWPWSPITWFIILSFIVSCFLAAGLILWILRSNRRP